jgi:hypothetical protein
MKALARPVWNLTSFFGWDALHLEEIFENAADGLRMKDDTRFWRS